MLIKGGIPPDQPYWGLWKKSRQEEECYGREEVGDSGGNVLVIEMHTNGTSIGREEGGGSFR